MSFEGQTVYYTDQQLVNDFNQRDAFGQGDETKMQLSQAEQVFMHFLTQVQVRNTYIYR